MYDDLPIAAYIFMGLFEVVEYIALTLLGATIAALVLGAHIHITFP